MRKTASVCQSFKKLDGTSIPRHVRNYNAVRRYPSLRYYVLSTVPRLLLVRIRYFIFYLPLVSGCDVVVSSIIRSSISTMSGSEGGTLRSSMFGTSATVQKDITMMLFVPLRFAQKSCKLKSHNTQSNTV